MKDREEEITIDLVEMWHAIKKRNGFVKKVTAGCMAVAALYLVVVPPTYESTALLRVKQPRGIGASLLDSIPGGNVQVTQQLMSTYSEILKSRSVVVPVIEKTEEANKDGKYPDYDAFVKGRITTNPFKNTEIMQVTFKAKTAEEAQKGNQLLVNGFLSRLTELVRTEQKATREFINDRVLASKEVLAVADNKLNAFKKENKVLEPGSQVKMAVDKLSMADKLRAENQVALEAAHARNNAVNKQLDTSAPSIADNTVIKNYQSKLSALEAKRIQQLDKYTEKHPAVIEVNKEIAGLKRVLNAEIEKVASLEAPSDNAVYQGLLADKFKSEAEMAVAKSNLDTLKRIDDAYQKDIEKLSDTEKEYMTLLRDETVAKEIYVMLAKRLEEAKVAEVAVSTEVQVVDTPTLPERPVAPRKGVTMLIAMLLGLLGSSGFIVANELMNRTVKNAEDVENYLGLPVLGSVPNYASMEKAMSKAEEEVGFLGKIWRALWKK